MFLSILSKFQLGHSVIHPFSINDAKHREGGEDWIYGHLHKLMNTVYKGEKPMSFTLYKLVAPFLLWFYLLLKVEMAQT